MPYTAAYYLTGATTLPFTLLDGRYDLSTSGDSPTPTTPLPNGEYDEYGDDRSPRRAQTVKIEETYLDPGYNTAIKAWKAVHRTKGRLYRQDDDTGLFQWTTARLRAIPITRTVDNAVEQGIGLTFFLPDPLWFGEHHGGIALLWGAVGSGGSGITWGSGHAWGETTGGTFPLTSGGATVVALPNNGDETVENGIFTFVIGDAAVTSIHVVCVALGIDFTWTGTAAALSLLVFDTAQQRITNAGVGAYSGFVRNAGHTVDQPIAMPVPPGGASYTITIAGGGSVVTSYLRPDYSDSYP